MEGRKIKEKQKREIKKIEDNKELRITFSKRKYDIYKKASELSTLCGAKVDILMFTSFGKWFRYGEPSCQAMTRSSDKENLTGDDINKLMEDHINVEIDELYEKNKTLVGQLYCEEERENELVKSLNTRSTQGWWEAKIQDLSIEQANEMEASFVELRKKLENELLTKCKEKGHSSHVNEVNLCSTYPSGDSISEVVFGVNTEAHGISESVLPNISLIPINEGLNFKFFPYGEHKEDLFDIVYPPKTQAHGDSFFVDDQNGSDKCAFNSFPTKQTQGLNLVNANGISDHTLIFSSSNQHEGNNPFLPNASNEIVGKIGNENVGQNAYDVFLSPFI